MYIACSISLDTHYKHSPVANKLEYTVIRTLGNIRGRTPSHSTPKLSRLHPMCLLARKKEESKKGDLDPKGRKVETKERREIIHAHTVEPPVTKSTGNASSLCNIGKFTK